MTTETSLSIRRARHDDAGAIARIFNEAVEERIATFQTRPSDPADFGARLEAGPRVPVLIAERAGSVAGWAGIIPYSDRDFYAGVGEYQLYVERSRRGGGVGRRLLDGLVAEAAGLGYWKLVGKLFASNAASIALAHRCGFRDVGVHLRHSRLDGEWLDVLIVERLLGEAEVG